MSNLSQHIRRLAQSSTTPQTLLDIAEDVQEIEDENSRLRDAQLRLSAFEAAGVDSWPGVFDAMNIYGEWKGGE